MSVFARAWQVNYFGLLSSFPLTVFPVPKHIPMALHAHGPYWELVIVAEGRGQHRFGQDTFALGAGDVLVIPRGVQHGYGHCADLGLINVMFEPNRLHLPMAELRRVDGFSELFEFTAKSRTKPASFRHLKVDPQTLARLVDILEKLHAELLARRPGFELLIKGHFASVLVELARHQTGVSTTPLPEAYARLSGVIDWVGKNVSQQIAVEQLAEVAHCSRSTLERLFQKCFSTSPLNYVLRLRVHEAEKLLQATDASIAEIAVQVGMSDSSYFTRMFRRQTGVLPKEYRAQNAYQRTASKASSSFG